MKRLERLEITRRTVVAWVLVCTVLSIIAAAVAPDPDGVDTQSFEILLYTSTALEVLSWMAVPVAAWFIATRVRSLRHACESATSSESPSRSFHIMLGQYIVALVIFAMLCEAPYDYACTGQWWNLNSQNPVWALVIALVTYAGWDALSVYSSRSRKSTRAMIVIAAIIWAIAFRTLVSVTVMSLVFLIWQPDYELTWRRFTINRQCALIVSCVGCGITPLVGLWMTEHVTKVRSRRSLSPILRQLSNQWLIWWAYPLFLLVCAAVRMGITAIMM